MSLEFLSIRNFRPGLLTTLLAIALLVLFVRLGFWQLERAKEKQSLKEQVVSRQSLPPLTSLPVNVENSSSLYWRRASLKSSMTTDITFLLDNQVHQGQAGYFVYSVLKLDGNINVLVNRGWVRANPDRTIINLPDVSASAQVLTGIIKAPPATGWLLAEDTDEQLANGLVRLQHIDPVRINDRYQLNIVPYIFRLDQNSPAGYIRDWRAPGFGRKKHLGYAFQWFAMAFALLIIYFVVNTNRNKNDK